MLDTAAFQALRRGHWGATIEWHDEIKSTQDALRERGREGALTHGTVLGAEAQSAGRGRWGRHWEGVAGQSLLFTLAVSTAGLKGSLSQAPLVLGVGLQQALAKLGLGVALRWPNDLTWQGQKLAGLLVEQEGGDVLVGLGLNVAQGTEGFSPELAGRATSLKLAGIKELRREALLAALLQGMESAWERWQHEGFEPLRHAWDAVAEGRGTLVKVQPTAGKAWTGRLQGLHESGALLLEDEKGAARMLTSGEVQRLQFS